MQSRVAVIYTHEHKLAGQATAYMGTDILVMSDPTEASSCHASSKNGLEGNREQE